MRLSKLYTNQPGLFEPITFVSGLNVVLAEIRLPENREKDTHNLGKSTLGRLLDFCFISGRKAEFFLFKHLDLFGKFVFFLEIELADGSYITIRRSVKEASKICFKKHNENHQDYSELPTSKWDHIDLPYKRACDMLDSLLDWRALKPWSYRKGLGYQLRSQEDYRDVFQLRNYVGVHADWKPYLAHILGFDANLIQSHYEILDALAKIKTTEETIKREMGGSVEDLSKFEGLLLLSQQEAEKKQRLLDAFDFRSHDKIRTKEVVNEIDGQISRLNTERYSLSFRKKKIQASLEAGQILFNPDESKRLFGEVGVIFDGQIKKDFEQLIAFNRAITEERQGFLLEEQEEVEIELKQINIELNDLGKRRSEALSFLSNTDIFEKYKQISDEMVNIRADIVSLERQSISLRRLQELRSEIRALTEASNSLQSQIEDNVEAQNIDKSSLFSSIRSCFNDIVEAVISRKALLTVSPNKEGHLEFKAEIRDETGKATSADIGHTYRKLLCIAFDLAVLRGHLDTGFPRFVFLDGVFESLDDRKKENLLTVLRQYADFGFQPVITLIDSDLPTRSDFGIPIFDQNEIVLTLHDEGDQGRLFKTSAW